CVYRSADFQSSVSPICNRQGAERSQDCRFCQRSAGYKPGTCLALNCPRTPGFERVPSRAPAFGVRQLAGAFARGTVESGAAWLALVDKKRRQVAAVQTLSRLRNRLPHACASCSLQAKHIPMPAFRETHTETEAVM